MIWLFLVALVNALAGAPGPQSPAPVVQSVHIEVPFAPVVFTQEHRTQLVYELHITNFQRTDVTVTAVTVEAPNTVLGQFTDADLRQRMVRPGLRNDHATPQVIGPGMRAVVNVWLQTMEPFGPESVTNIVDVELASARAQVRNTIPVRQVYRPATVLDAPLGAGQWVAIYDPLLKGGHRTAIYTLDGRARIPGRFAIDFIRMPSGGAYARTPEAGDWNGRGADVLAVADGTIAAAVDGEPDNPLSPVPADKASGNYITIDMGAGQFAFYEHLLRGSVRVKAGQAVRRGDVIAQVGSSGSSSIGPHLHLHVADANSVLGAEGTPFVFRRYTGFGGFSSIDALMKGEQWQPGTSASVRFNARPGPNTVISFR
ncbi:MAG: M23 family metallopeptidase [Cyanobacteria bacterium]|nr:M23 family metallopeptidase [Cyanobacteriota bacterium]